MSRTLKVKYEELPHTKTPTLTYCRKLIQNGENPENRLEVYRNNPDPDVIVENIGRAALITVLEDRGQGPRFVKYKDVSPTLRNRINNKIRGTPPC